MKIGGRTEPVYVAKCSDDLWLAAKYQSNSAIAGSPRNVFKYSLKIIAMGVEILDGSEARKGTPLNQTPNTIVNS